ncbi:unnamed protein product [Caenorhabditis auriculariae]|uniref:Gamma-glutamyltranspeptidase 1 n=1 Tax=Caenorhabditis auriculariae TaxID=2777116 RepID=A0A8S1HBB6_9PELO|nr:unnamed protein product [Caenorhabditis auriculariae]
MEPKAWAGPARVGPPDLTRKPVSDDSCGVEELKQNNAASDNNRPVPQFFPFATIADLSARRMNTRVGDVESPRRGSPSEVFSRDIDRIHKDGHHKKTRWARTMAIVCAVLATVFLLSTVALAIVVGIKYSQDDKQKESTEPRQNSHFDWPAPSGSLFAHYKKAAVASDHGLCSEIGRDVLIDGGNAVDSMIATLLCIGTVNPQSSGIGGGFLMTLYNSSTGLCQSINARESAPSGATETMFVANPSESVVGYKSIATPGEVHGYWTVFNKFGSGKVTWRRLFEPSISLAHSGFPVSSNLAMVLADKEKLIREDPNMKDIFVNPRTNRVYEEGDILKRHRLANTYSLLANATDPVELFYKGGVAQTIAGEITDNGGLVNESDLAAYETLIEDSPLISGHLPGDLEMCGPPPPSSFVITQAIVNIMAQFYKDGKVDLDDPLVYHRLIEAEKFAYGQRTKLGDPRYVETSKQLVEEMMSAEYAKKIAQKIADVAQPIEFYGSDMTGMAPDHGTSHVTIIDAQGNAVSTTSTINQIFGAVRASPTLGIVWNDQMDDFSSPGLKNSFGYAPSETNFIAPGKRPMSSMSPMIIYNKNENRVEMVVGASGGSYIISSTAQTVVRSLLFNQTVKQAVDSPRFHNQYLPEATECEEAVPIELRKVLVEQYKQNFTMVPKQKSVVQALQSEEGFINGNSDFRRATATYPAGY